MTCCSYVAASRVGSRHVPPQSAGNGGENPSPPVVLLPSEGRGQRFESSRVRHFPTFQAPFVAVTVAVTLRCCCCVPALFRNGATNTARA